MYILRPGGHGSTLGSGKSKRHFRPEGPRRHSRPLESIHVFLVFGSCRDILGSGGLRGIWTLAGHRGMSSSSRAYSSILGLLGSIETLPSGRGHWRHFRPWGMKSFWAPVSVGTFWVLGRCRGTSAHWGQGVRWGA